MLVLVIVLAVTSAAALAALAALTLAVYRPPPWLRSRVLATVPEIDEQAAAALDRTPRPPMSNGTPRRLISIEILNPIELAGSRGRLAALAGTLAPGLTRRIVYDRTLKVLRGQLVEQQVHADVRVHTLRPAPPVDDGRPTVIDVAQPLDLCDEP